MTNKFFQFLRGNDSCRIINLTTVVLGLIVLFLVGIMMWRIYQNYQMANRIVQANELADKILIAASIQAMERGLTAAALGSPGGSIGSIGMEQLQDLRSQGDSVWGEALNIAKDLASRIPSDSAYNKLFVEAVQRHSALQKMRQRVDQGLITGEREIIDEWVATITNFISAAARLRDAAFATAEGVSDEISYLNIILRRNAWLIAEHTGLERGVLAFYIASRRAVPEETQDVLRDYRGVVERNLRELSTVSVLLESSHRYSDAIEILQKQFSGEFENLRKYAYSGVRTGDYPLGVDRWWDKATEAVDAVLAVSSLVGEIANEKARILAVESLRLLVGYAVLSVVAILFVLGSITRVGRTANALSRQKELAEVTLHSIGDAVITTDTSANIEYLNPLAEELT
ncbi:MAG: nitrate- and nitrite sensing domain-containing protein, partial [Gammaproteobacteria bacterium]|nr:nitrate- and nitrite sensing domain-containing protein [Gammaproteobacteria bacterium]